MRHWFLWRREAVEYLHGYPRWDEALVQERGSKVVMGTGFGALDDSKGLFGLVKPSSKAKQNAGS